jgi:serine/threonine protein phosphatase PrpC
MNGTGNGNGAALVATDATVICGTCGAEVFSGELYCENCGAEVPGAQRPAAEMSTSGPATQPIEHAPLVPLATSCLNCGGTAFEDGYCSTCGAPAARERDHWVEHPAAWVGAVCDRGIRHTRNEDAVAVSAEPEPGSRAILVVCDGVSSSIDPDVASLAGARAARDVLTAGDPDTATIGGRIRGWTDLLTQAAAAANAEAVEAFLNPTHRPGERQDSPPSCTFAAAVVDGPVVVAGWVGDSRVYWMPDAGPAEQLSVDDSWATEQVLAGMPRAQAESAPQAHAITRWLGRDSPDVVPKCAARTRSGPGWLLVCSDGLWNYCSEAVELGALLSRTAAATGNDPVATAAELVNWANAQGGQDNITVALARLDATPDVLPSS